MSNIITRHIPNTLTCCNLLCGCMAIMKVCGPISNLSAAIIFILAGAAFDFCDGAAARLFKAYSPIGKELDSLADVVTFGVAPAFICVNCLPMSHNLGLAGLVIAAGAALRLAKFNTDERQSSSFLGLPVPANALFWCGLAWWMKDCQEVSQAAQAGLIALMIGFALLMNSEIPMFSLKFKNLGWRDNSLRYIFLAVSVILLAAFGLKGTAIVIIWYVLLSIVTSRTK